ncbi:MAG: YgjV family protein [Gemmatimonadetes bacterium]|nr:YgjV family protein [Gemmatimonadota bacterium]
MDTQLLYEMIGYVASALVAISLMMSSLLRLRLINLAGSAAFTVYGVLIEAYPVAAVNGIIVVINLFYLYRMLRTREYFRLLSVEPDSQYLRQFLSFYQREIRRFLPGFAYTPAPDDLAIFVLRDMVPAGLLIGGREQGGRLCVTLDFVIPQYRDFKIGRYLFREEREFFRARGFHEIESDPGTREHAAYLRRMGFAPGAAAGDRYRLSV